MTQVKRCLAFQSECSCNQAVLTAAFTVVLGRSHGHYTVNGPLRFKVNIRPGATVHETTLRCTADTVLMQLNLFNFHDTCFSKTTCLNMQISTKR